MDPLDIEHPAALLAYLRNTGWIDADETVTTRILAGGVSNRTVLVERTSGESWVLKQALAKLRVAVDWFSDPARVRREAEGLRWLDRLAPPGSITPLVFEDVDHHLLAMQAVPEPHENWKMVLLAGRVEGAHVRQFAVLLGQVHRQSWIQRDEVAPAFDDRSFFESLRIEPYYQYTAGQVPDASEFLEGLIAATRSRRFALVHGDYSPKNVLVHAGRLVLLDHEVIHWGDPAFDVGFALTHFLSKARHVAECRDAFLAAANLFWKTYRDSLSDVPWAADLESFAIRHTLACLLARVCGRSPLEYLTPAEREAQRAAVVAAMREPPATVGDRVSL